MNFSKVTESLYIGTTPKVKDYELLLSVGISLVINMRFNTPPIAELFMPPLKSLWLPTIDSPLFPIPISMLKKGVEAALDEIRAGGIVLSHCAKGRHRSVAMAASILIAQGMSPDDAMRLIKEQRPISDPRIWYIQSRIRIFAADWTKQQAQEFVKK